MVKWPSFCFITKEAEDIAATIDTSRLLPLVHFSIYAVLRLRVCANCKLAISNCPAVMIALTKATYNINNIINIAEDQAKREEQSHCIHVWHQYKKEVNKA